MRTAHFSRYNKKSTLCSSGAKGTFLFMHCIRRNSHCHYHLRFQYICCRYRYRAVHSLMYGDGQIPARTDPGRNRDICSKCRLHHSSSDNCVGIVPCKELAGRFCKILKWLLYKDRNYLKGQLLHSCYSLH